MQRLTALARLTTAEAAMALTRVLQNCVHHTTCRVSTVEQMREFKPGPRGQCTRVRTTDQDPLGTFRSAPQSVVPKRLLSQFSHDANTPSLDCTDLIPNFEVCKVVDSLAGIVQRQIARCWQQRLSEQSFSETLNTDHPLTTLLPKKRCSTDTTNAPN